MPMPEQRGAMPQPRAFTNRLTLLIREGTARGR